MKAMSYLIIIVAIRWQKNLLEGLVLGFHPLQH